MQMSYSCLGWPFVQSMDVMSILRSLPCGLLASDAVQFSVNAYSALGTGDMKMFLRLHGKADWRQLRFLNHKMCKARVSAVLCDVHLADHHVSLMLA